MFTAHHPSRGGITWDNGDFTGNPILLEEIIALIDSGARVPTIEVGPDPIAASSPDWVAWFTARYALEDYGLNWSEGPSMPRELRLIPPNAVS
jgi:hypothetical protein